MRRAQLVSVLLWLVALGLSAWTLAQLPLAEIASSITALTTPQWIFWLALNGIIILVLGVRWQVLTHALAGKINLFKLLLIRQAGQAVSFITPGPQFGGEPLQVYWLYKQGLPLAKALLSLGLDRFFELWVNFSVLLLAVLLLLVGVDGNQYSIGSWQTMLLPLLIFLGVLMGCAAIIIKQPQWINHRLGQMTARWQGDHRLHKLSQHWQSVGDELRIVLRTQKPRLLIAMFLSLLGWAGLLGELHLILHFVDVEVSLTGFLIILVAMRMALLLPTPGGLGTLEASVLWSFHTLELSASAALGLIALMRLRDAMVLVIGLVCLRASHSASTETNLADGH